MANDTTVYLPKQHTSRGVAGYKATHGDSVVVVAKDATRRTAEEDATENAKVVSANQKASASKADKG